MFIARACQAATTASGCEAPTNSPLRSGGSKPEGLARGCEAPERAKRAEPEGLVLREGRMWEGSAGGLGCGVKGKVREVSGI